MTKEVNFIVERGDTFKKVLYFTDSDTGDKVDITNWTIYFTIKVNEDDNDDAAIIKKDIINHTDPTNGKTTIEVLASETNSILGKHYCDFQFKKPNGEIKTICKGTITFGKDITRRVD